MQDWRIGNMGDETVPKVSVIMPAYDAETYIAEAIDSILGQTFRDFEFIIIDDASSDRTAEIVKSCSDDRIRFYRNEHNMGVAAALNRGLDLASGEYIARMDADDISLPERFQKQIAYLERHPACGICGSNLRVFSGKQEEWTAVYAEGDARIRADMVFNSAFAHPSVMLRAGALDGLRYDRGYEKAEDYELWYRLLARTKGHNIQEPLLRYRHHAAQVTQTQKPEQRASVVKLHEKMLKDIGVSLTREEWVVFLKICGGTRILSHEEYMDFVSGGEKILLSFGKGAAELKAVYSALNRAIKLRSGICGRTCFSRMEPMQDMLSKMRGVLRGR